MMTPRDVFDGLVFLYRSADEIKSDIKQLCDDAMEHGISRKDIAHIKRLAAARAADKDEEKVQDARDLISVAEQLDLFGMSEAA